jgi:outer membrane protein TolC
LACSSPPSSTWSAARSAGGSATNPAAPAERDWWRLYRDPVLDQLIADALAANTDVRVAVARLARARASLREARIERTPQVGVSAGAQYGRVPFGQNETGGDRENWNVDLGVDVAYEADLFGRISRGVEAARGDVAAADADIAAAQVLVVAETARAYADAASAAERQAVAERIVALLDRSILLTQRRYEVGLGNRLDAGRPCASTSRSRSATAPRCSPAAPTCAPPSAGWRLRRRGSASRPQTFIRASPWAVRSGRAEGASAICSGPARSHGCSARYSIGR